MDRPPATGRRAERLALAVVWLTAAALSVELLALMARIVIDFPLQVDAGYPDSALVVRIEGFLSRGELFPPLDRPPYLITVYGPLTYLVLSVPYAAAEAIGLDPVLALRLVEVALLCASVGVVAVLTHQFTRARTMVLLAILLAVAGAPLRPWVLQLRGDFLGLFLSLACVALCVRGNAGAAFRTAAVLGGLAIITKQTFIAAPAAVILWLVWQRQFRRAAAWGGMVSAVVVAGYGIMLVREPSLVHHVAALRIPVFEYRTAAAILLTAVMHVKALYSVAGAAVLVRSADAKARLVVLYWALSWVVAAATIPQVGGNINYFWEPWFVSSILAAVAIGAAVRLAGRIPVAVAVALVLLHFRVLADGTLSAQRELRDFTAARARAEETDRGLGRLGRAVGGYVVLSSTPTLARLSSTPVLPDPYLTSVLVRTGSWEPAPFLASVIRGDFDAVIGYNLNDTIAYRGLAQWHPMRETAGSHPYEVACTVMGHSVWLTPASPLELRRRLADAGCRESTR
jgi:hypothetical protein